MMMDGLATLATETGLRSFVIIKMSAKIIEKVAWW